MSAAGALAAGEPQAGSPPFPLIVDAPPELQATAQRLELELDWFHRLSETASILSIWQPQRALAVTALEAAMPNFSAAADAAARRGFPVQVRRSGGGCVCLGPGTLVISHLYCSAMSDIDRSYRDFAARLIAATARLGIVLRVGQVPAAYCDGRFDLGWNGLKVGGIAQRRRARVGVSNVWVHAVLSVEERSLAYPPQVTAFYRDLGSDRIARHTLTTALERCACAVHAGAEGASDLLARCTDELAHVFTAAAARRVS